MEFEQIYNTYFKAVYRYIWQLSGNEHIAEEITGETFFKAMKSINNFRGECDMRVWLCQIAKNTYFSYLKKNGKIESMTKQNFRILLTRMILLMSRLILRKKQRNYGKSYIVYLNHIRKFSCGVSLGNYHLMK